jgi:uncharacterized protein YpuA (DUF1002 family)
MLEFTLSDIQSVLVFIASLSTAGGIIAKFATSSVKKIMSEQLAQTNQKIDYLTAKITQVDTDTTKNYIQQMISALDAGEPIDSVAIKRFYENYDHYVNDLHLNSWVHASVERLESEGKLRR